MRVPWRPSIQIKFKDTYYDEQFHRFLRVICTASIFINKILTCCSYFVTSNICHNKINISEDARPWTIQYKFKDTYYDDKFHRFLLLHNVLL